MSEREFWDALGEIDGGLIEEAGKRLAEKEERGRAWERRRGRRRIAMRIGGMAAMASLVIFLGARYGSVPEKTSMQRSEKNFLIQKASEPERQEDRMEKAADEAPQSPEEKKTTSFGDSNAKSSVQSSEADAKMGEFYEASIGGTLLKHIGENVVYSPINLYLALGMLSELGDGNTRQDILSVMEEGSLENARNRCMELRSLMCWRENTFDPVLGHSVWLGEGIDYDRDMVGVLGESHCASVFQGTEGRERAQAADDWLDDFLVSSSGKMDGGEASQNGFDLLSACSIEESWREGIGFDRRGTGEGIFYQRDGREREVSFMGGVVQEGDVTVAKRYCAADLGLSGGSRLSVYLPKEGVDIEEMLRKDLRHILSDSPEEEHEEREQDSVQVFLPEFQVSSSVILNDVLEEMGLQDIFLEGMADFSPLLAEKKGGEGEEEPSPYVGEIRQSTELALDEAGCRTRFRKGAENTGKGEDGDGDGRKDENAFICNRPFVFIVWSQEELPVLAGMIHAFE